MWLVDRLKALARKFGLMRPWAFPDEINIILPTRGRRAHDGPLRKWWRKRMTQNGWTQLAMTDVHVWTLPTARGPLAVIGSGKDRPAEVLVSLQWHHPELERLELPIPLPLAKQLLGDLQQLMVQIDKQMSDQLDRKR